MLALGLLWRGQMLLGYLLQKNLECCLDIFFKKILNLSPELISVVVRSLNL